jgi:hypothetical protein
VGGARTCGGSDAERGRETKASPRSSVSESKGASDTGLASPDTGTVRRQCVRARARACVCVCRRRPEQARHRLETMGNKCQEAHIEGTRGE